MSQTPPTDELSDLRRRIELLEDEHQRLRQKLEPLLGGPENPCFDPARFGRVLQRFMLTVMLPLYLAIAIMAPLSVVGRRIFPPMNVMGLRVFDVGGVGTRHPGVGAGVFAVGGVAFGLIAFGGAGVGLVALGGGAVGIVAIGGGSIGLIAFGGGACGVIAVGGGACGYYALGQRGAGKYVLALNRQDDEAIEFFSRYIPRLRDACTRPMPVLPAKPAKNA